MLLTSWQNKQNKKILSETFFSRDTSKLVHSTALNQYNLVFRIDTTFLDSRWLIKVLINFLCTPPYVSDAMVRLFILNCVYNCELRLPPNKIYAYRDGYRTFRSRLSSLSYMVSPWLITEPWTKRFFT